VVRNYNTLLGQDGIAGLKTGSTQAAGGCVLIAAWHQAGRHKTLIVAATFGQPGTAQTILPNALQAGHNLVLALDRALGPGARPTRKAGDLHVLLSRLDLRGAVLAGFAMGTGEAARYLPRATADLIKQAAQRAAAC